MRTYKTVTPGCKISYLTLIKDVTRPHAVNRTGLWQCDCGNTIPARVSTVVNKHTTCCRNCSSGIRGITPGRWIELQQLLKSGLTIEAASKRLFIRSPNVRSWRKLIDAHGIHAFQRRVIDITEQEFNEKLQQIAGGDHVETLQKVS